MICYSRARVHITMLMGIRYICRCSKNHVTEVAEEQALKTSDQFFLNFIFLL